MDGVAILRKKVVVIDAYGNEIETYSERQVYCKARSTTRSEFYSAAQAGLRPEIIMVLQNKADYEGEDEVEYSGKVYKVIRTYWDDKDPVELTLAEKVTANGI